MSNITPVRKSSKSINNSESPKCFECNQILTIYTQYMLNNKIYCISCYHTLINKPILHLKIPPIIYAPIKTPVLPITPIKTPIILKMGTIQLV